MIAAHKLQLNPVSPENLLEPIPLYRELRIREPVYWSDAVQAWFITRHEDVVACFRDPRLSANRTKLFEYQLREPGPSAFPAFLRFVYQQLAMKDGAEHLRARRQLNPSFTFQELEAWQPVIRRLMEELVDRVQPRGEMELVQELSSQLPPLVIAELLGVPAEDRERFVAWAKSLAEVSSFTPDADLKSVALRAEEVTREMSAYLGAVIEERRRAPGQEVLSRMIAAQEEGGTAPEELLANAVFLLFAGHITTDQISNGVHDLLTNPEQLQRLREEPGLVKSAVEEILRYNPAVSFMHRLAAESFELHGKRLREGSLVFLGLAAANRDPLIFPEPDRFDITRPSARQRHLSFGFGPHQCLGAWLARSELEAVLEVLLRRLPGLRLDERCPPRRKGPSLIFRGFESLHVRW
jgi:cytochrome P450